MPKEESLLVLRSLGIQTSTTSSTYLSTSTTRFIPTSQIQDIFIHEAFKGFEVRYYLAVVVKDEAEVVVVFPVSCGLHATMETSVQYHALPDSIGLMNYSNRHCCQDEPLWRRFGEEQEPVY